MFTWLQTHIQKHHKIIFGIILVVVIISFVFTIGNFGGFGNPVNPNEQPKNFYGFNLNSQRDRSYLEQGLAISSQLNRQRINSPERDMLARAVKLHLANELMIPQPSEEAFLEYVRARPAFMDFRTGEYSHNQYTQILDMLKNNARISEETVADILGQDYRIAQVDKALGGPGYVLPYEAVEVIKRRDTVWSIDVAELKREDFKPEIEVTDEALQTYYEENKARYETAPMASAEYVMFNTEDFLEEVPEPSQEQLTKYYNSNRAKWPKNDEGATEPLENIEDEVTAEWKREQAKDLALHAANELVVEIDNAVYEKTIEQGAESVEAFVSKHGQTLEPLPPFSATDVPANAPLPAKALRQALSLTGDRFYTDGLVTNEGGAIIIVKSMSETTIPPLSEIRDQVVADYKADEEQRQFNLAGQENQKKLQAAVDEGKSFEEEAKALGLTVQTYDDFNFNKSPEGIDNFILQTIENMSQGEVSNLVGFGDVGTIVYVEKRDIPEVSSDSEEVQNLISQLNRGAARATRMTIVNELITIGSEKLDAKKL